MYEEYQDKLWDQPVPVDVLRWFALHGTPLDLHQVTARSDLPEEVSLLIATNGSAEARDGLSYNWAVPEPVISLLYPDADGAGRERLASHPNAPVELILTSRFDRIPPLTLHRFFEAVNATDDEREQLLRAGETRRGGTKTLQVLWERVRP